MLDIRRVLESSASLKKDLKNIVKFVNMLFYPDNIRDAGVTSGAGLEQYGAAFCIICC